MLTTSQTLSSIRELSKAGVTRLRIGELEVSFGFPLSASAALSSTPEVDESKEDADVEKRSVIDGATKAEQLDLYGGVLDEAFVSEREGVE